MAATSFCPFIAPRPSLSSPEVHRAAISARRLLPLAIPLRRNQLILHRRISAQGNSGGPAETLGGQNEKEIGAKEEEEGEKKAAAVAVAVAEEIREMMASRKEKERSKAEEMLGGVAEEVREIEWPEFRKVVGTTGVVLAVISGSSVALLTVNALLSELSDRVFVGRGVQDFFSG